MKKIRVEKTSYVVRRVGTNQFLIWSGNGPLYTLTTLIRDTSLLGFRTTRAAEDFIDLVHNRDKRSFVYLYDRKTKKLETRLLHTIPLEVVKLKVTCEIE